MEQTTVQVKNRYMDSVSLMSLSERLKGMAGVVSAEVVMATPANREILEKQGLTVPENASPSDLLIAVAADNADVLAEACKTAESLLSGSAGGGRRRYTSLGQLAGSGYNLAQISLPGQYAFEQGKQALEMDMDVFIFSDNVTLEEERALKELGRERNRLVMGPDCGVGLIGGVALAAGSIVAPGRVGIVGASGSGAQEVACLVEACGLGVSSLIGTGGRDLYPEIGGITMSMGLSRLAADADTGVIVLVSKLADAAVMEDILTQADAAEKPTVAVFLGADRDLFASHRTIGATSLEDAALTAVELLTGERPALQPLDSDLALRAKAEAARLTPEQRYFRGLYCGGTFVEEALVWLSSQHPHLPLTSNLKTRYARQLDDHEISEENCLLDLGAEDFTALTPHPVFDPAIRLKRFQRELADPTVGLISLDFITGPSLHPHPADAFIELCRRAPELRGNAPIILAANICGAKGDPQNVEDIKRKLAEAGVVLTRSSRQSAYFAGLVMDRMRKGEAANGLHTTAHV